MTEEMVRSWLDAYGRAWETRDPEAVVRLFTEDGTYQETPFVEPMAGSRRLLTTGPEPPDHTPMFILDTSFWPWIQIRVLPIGGVRSSDRRRRHRSNWTASLSSSLMAGDAAGRFASGGIGKRIRPGERPFLAGFLTKL